MIQSAAIATRHLTMDLSIKVWPQTPEQMTSENSQEFIASCPELDVFCYGDSYDQARKRLKKVIVFYAETASQLGYDIDTADLLSSLDTPGKIHTEYAIN